MHTKEDAKKKMKHNLKLTLILISMFIITQFIGLGMIHIYNSSQEVEVLNQTTGQLENITITPQIPYGLQPPEIEAASALWSISISMVIAILLVLLLMTIKANLFLRLWFFVVATIAIAISINGIFIITKLPLQYQAIIALIIALPLAFFKVFKQNLIIHNLTELIIYPGIAAILVPIFSIWTVIIFLILISVYDIYAVWHAKFMQKMAKFQINELKVFSGFFVPYIRPEDRRFLNKKGKGKKIKVSLAILGGGDIALPILAAGVVLLSQGFLAAITVSLFATLALLYLFLFSKKGKYYPAMPFITTGIFIGMLVAYLVLPLF